MCEGQGAQLSTSRQQDSQLSTSLVRVHSTSILTSVVALVIAVAIIYLLWSALRPLAIFLASIVIAEALDPIVQRVEKYMRRSIAVVLTHVLLLIILVGTLFLIIPPFVGEIQTVIEDLPETRDRIEQQLENIGFLSMSQIESYASGMFQGGEGGGLAAVPLLIASTIAELLFAVFISIYWLIGKSGVRKFVLSLVPDPQTEQAGDVMSEMGQTVGGYVRGVVFTGLILGIISFIGLMLIGIDFALPLAVLVLLGELVPVLGPVFAAIPALLIAALAGPWQFGLVLALYIVLQQLESAFLQPQIMKHEAHIPPLLVLFALLAGGSVGGILGALVAIPLAGAIRVLLLRVVVPMAQRKFGAHEPATESG